MTDFLTDEEIEAKRLIRKTFKERDKYKTLAEQAAKREDILFVGLKKSIQNIEALCSTVNILNAKLGGTPRKVRTEDFTEAAHNAICDYAAAKAKTL